MQYLNSDILSMSKGDFFGIGNAQLPNSLMLMIDQINHISENGGQFKKGRVDASLKIQPQHWFFACHFLGDPVMPGCLGLDALWQLLGVFLGCAGLPGRGRALGVGKVRFSGQVYPDAGEIHYQLHIKRIFKKPLIMGIADGLVLHHDKIIYRADDLKVGLLKN